MSELDDISLFGSRLRESFEAFRQFEKLHRVQYAREGAMELPSVDHSAREILERTTRRFLIDDFLRGLDWNPDDPTSIAEEARAVSKSEDRLYFDYLGIAPRTGSPIMLVEAKGYDALAPRQAHGPELDAQSMPFLLASAIDGIKRGESTATIISSWYGWLRDLHTYIQSLSPQVTLQRAIVTAGRWIVVFKDPVTAFVNSSPCNAEHIGCYTSLEDILNRHAELFRSLHRQRLIDTLPTTLKIPEALQVIKPTTIKACYRGAVVATTTSGARRQIYPTRSVYPSLIVDTGGRLFGVTDYSRELEEPRDGSNYSNFVTTLSQHGLELEQSLKTWFGSTGPQPLALNDFPGFPAEYKLAHALGARDAPVTGSTFDRVQSAAVSSRMFVIHTGEAGAPAEFLIATGADWFYKNAIANGPSCDFHQWKIAREKKVAAEQPQIGAKVTSFTEDGQERHCEHEPLRGLRSGRCHVKPVESHMCCRACIFYSHCWAADPHQLPCPPLAGGLSQLPPFPVTVVSVGYKRSKESGHQTDEP